jgi:tyrosine decarboxylase/aspartate 1-decarboxylase
MENKGRSRKEILAELRFVLVEDARYKDGKILCSMCTNPQPIAKVAHQMFLCSNLGDSGLFLGSRRLEQDVIRKLANLLNCGNGVGFIVSGGTEANLLALLAARNWLDVSNPEVVLPESAHFSFHKICSILKLKPVWAELDNAYRVLPESVERCITDRTIAIVGTAGTAELGVVDPIGRLSEIALAHRVHLHVDAALGGLVIPFLKPVEKDALEFDFHLEGVKSMTIDPHKMGMSTIPAGGILFRDQTYLKSIQTETPYLSDEVQHTFVGTRSAASVAATWAVFESLGREGFNKTVGRCMALTKLLAKSVENFSLKLVAQPTLNIVAFRTSNSKKTAENLRKQGWYVSYVPRLDCVRIVIMPHLKRKHVQLFLTDLSKKHGE